MKQSVNNLELKKSLYLDKNEKDNLVFSHILALKFENFTVKNGIKNWNYQCRYPVIVALFAKEEDKLNNVIKSIAGVNNVIEGKILLNDANITYQPAGWSRQVSYFGANNKYYWNKLFSVQYNLIRTGMKNDDFLEEVFKNNQIIKIKIASWKNTALILDRDHFKTKIVSIAQKFINETETTRNILIKEYEEQINHFHEEFAKNHFNFAGNVSLIKILIKKFYAEEENIIANNNLLFYQSLFDRIASLTNLVDDCFCGCKPPKKRVKEFRLKELLYALKEINYHLNNKIAAARKTIKVTLKRCNIHNQHYYEVLNDMLTYKKLSLSRGEIDDKLEKWVDMAEIQRIKFNMKQDFLAMQILPDEMNSLIKNVKDEIKNFHNKLLNEPEIQDITSYNEHLHVLEKQLINDRSVINKNIVKIFSCLNLSDLLTKKYADLNSLERRIVLIAQQLVIANKVLVMENPFQLLNDDDKKTLAEYLKILAEALKIIVIFSSKNQKDIELLATDIVVIENEVAIQQGLLDNVKTKPLSLSFLKETYQNHLNVLQGTWNKPCLSFADVTIATLSETNVEPIIAVAATDIIFSYKKPRFNFFKRAITIAGRIKNISNIGENAAYLIFETNHHQLIEVFVNDLTKISIGIKGWIIIKRNTFYIFDGETHQLLNTW